MIIAILAPGAMGSAIGARLAGHGVRVLTSTSGRGPASRTRAEKAGMLAASDREIAAADIILSIVPPSDALANAERYAEAMATTPRKPLYVDCNAVDVATVETIAAVIARAGASFVDAGIIGGPPRPGHAGPKLYCSGEEAASLNKLKDYDIDVRIVRGPIGAASALKMSYAGITKGFTALGAAMILGATRAGAADALRDELADSAPQLLARLLKALPDMYPKAYRWAGEMEEVSAFLRDDEAATAIFAGAAKLYERLARDERGDRAEIGQIDAFIDGASDGDATR